MPTNSPPSIAQDQLFTVLSSDVNTTFGVLNATDSEGDSLNYLLLPHNSSGSDTSIFDIDLLTGELSLTESLNISIPINITVTVEVFEVLDENTRLFTPLPEITVGTFPRDIVAGHFNNDSALDLAVTNWSDDTINILMGNNTGAFTVLPPIEVGTRPWGIISGDFNQDGALDLAVTNQIDNNISILVGDGEGGFNVSSSILVGDSPRGITTCDFNQDGRLDLAVTNYNSFTVSILFGNSTGEFSINSAEQNMVGGSPDNLVVGDFNNDTWLDLAVTNSADNTVSLLFNTHTGGFNVSAPMGVELDPNSLVTGDFNQDGVIDIAVSNADSDSISLLMGRVTGGFNESRTILVGNWPSDIVTADFNADGLLDFATTNYFDNDVSILLGLGEGEFTALAPIVGGVQPWGITTGDFNVDGAVDLAVVNLSGTVDVLLNDRKPLLQSVANITVLIIPPPLPNQPPVIEPNQVFTLSIDAAQGDHVGFVNASDPEGSALHYVLRPTGNYSGLVDLNFHTGELSLATNLTAFTSTDVTITVDVLEAPTEYTNLFFSGPTLSVGSSPTGITTGDFNDDGQLDLGVANEGAISISILLGNGQGDFFVSQNLATGVLEPRRIISGDFNGDHALDLAVTHRLDNALSILLGDNANGFTLLLPIPFFNGPEALTTGDFNNDTLMDIAVTNYATGTINIVKGKLDGEFNVSQTVNVGTWPSGITTGDFDGDGDLDLAVSNEFDHTVSMLNNIGGGEFIPRLPIPLDATIFGITNGDFNQDGILDLAVTGMSANTVNIITGLGIGDFSVSSVLPMGRLSKAIEQADFNNDGRHDLVVTNRYNESVSVLMGDGLGGFTSLPLVSVRDYPSDIISADFNNDGLMDLAVTNQSNDTVSILLNDPMALRHTIANITLRIRAPQSISTDTGLTSTTSDPIEFSSTTTSITTSTTIITASSTSTSSTTMSAATSTSTSTGGTTSQATTSSNATATTTGSSTEPPELQDDEGGGFWFTVIPLVCGGLVSLGFFGFKVMMNRILDKGLSDMMRYGGKVEEQTVHKFFLAPILQNIRRIANIRGQLQCIDQQYVFAYFGAIAEIQRHLYISHQFLFSYEKYTVPERELLIATFARIIVRYAQSPNAKGCSGKCGSLFHPAIASENMMADAEAIANAIAETLTDELLQPSNRPLALNLESELGCEAVALRLNHTITLDFDWIMLLPNAKRAKPQVACMITDLEKLAALDHAVAAGMLAYEKNKTHIILTDINAGQLFTLLADSEYGSDFKTVNSTDTYASTQYSTGTGAIDDYTVVVPAAGVGVASNGGASTSRSAVELSMMSGITRKSDEQDPEKMDSFTTSSSANTTGTAGASR